MTPYQVKNDRYLKIIANVFYEPLIRQIRFTLSSYTVNGQEFPKAGDFIKNGSTKRGLSPISVPYFCVSPISVSPISLSPISSSISSSPKNQRIFAANRKSQTTIVTATRSMILNIGNGLTHLSMLVVRP